MMKSILSLFQHLRWQDFIDITINSYILFRIYVLFRGTTTFRVLLGVAGLLLFQQIATSLGLVVTSWLIQGITTVAALIIIVIFRNEIRSVLQTTNWKNMLWGFPKSYQLTPTETIAETIFEFSEDRTGALIVFPGKETLNNIIQKGIPWRGSISREMLKTIFWHNNPVHDGAIIIEGDQISDVACILPLSERKDLPSHFGTRHRAAIGLAALTDSLVVVVSEESGSVSVVKGNKIQHIKKSKDLCQKIEMHLGKKKETGFVQNETFQFGMAALLSVLFITSVWSNFSRSSDTLINLEVPIQFKNRPAGTEVINVSENTVLLQISGSTTLLRSIRSDKLHIEINLENATIGENTFALTIENTSLPPGITLNQIIPSTISVLTDTLVTKELPVQVDWTGKLPDPLLLTSVRVEPATVRLSGRGLILADIKTVYTKKIKLDSMKESDTIISEIVIDSSLKIVAEQSETVKIHYSVQKR